MGARDGKKAKNIKLTNTRREVISGAAKSRWKNNLRTQREKPRRLPGLFLAHKLQIRAVLYQKAFFVVKIAVFAIRKGDFVIRPGR